MRRRDGRSSGKKTLGWDRRDFFQVAAAAGLAAAAPRPLSAAQLSETAYKKASHARKSGSTLASPKGGTTSFSKKPVSN
ncbi:hypothetical protein BraRD5C2_38200 [Bradyrhizobium sp. RD5-C2]|nr:hypothetical protein BraRD5C2_38200 [Bradyrhizobium sp. RD5-C2]